MIAAVAFLLLLCRPADCGAAEREARLRIIWGAGGQAPQKWAGEITVAGGELAELQPLGVEADEAAAIRLRDDRIVAAPMIRRAFDGCDVTVRPAGPATLQIRLQNATAPAAKTIEIPLAEVLQADVRRPLDELGGFLTVSRAPGDRLRVRLARDHLVFSPGEKFAFTLEPDLVVDAAAGPITIEAQLRRVGSSDAAWREARPFDPATTEPLKWELATPKEEGAYRLTLTARRPPSFTDRLVPWEKHGAVAERDLEFVVIDPQQRLSVLSGETQVVQEIDPATTRWWQRLPQWTQWDLLPGFRTPRPLGNATPVVHASEGTTFVALPPTGAGGEPAWQAYVLSLREPGQPHALEIELPRGVRQHLSVSIVEPDAAGRVVRFGRDEGVSSEESFLPGDGSGKTGVERFRMNFWPRSRSPVLLVANRGGDREAQYGRIRILRRATTAATAAPPSWPTERLVAAYVAQPRLVETLGAAQLRDAASGLSVDGWSTTLEAIDRLAQQLRASGYNSLVLTIAADGGSLAPVAGLGQSPRLDSGLLAASGADPLRKDILEALLRVCDREQIRVIPALQLAAPLPELESLRDAAEPQRSGVEWIGFDGRRWDEAFPVAALGPHYNLLAPKTQAGVGRIVDRLVARYGAHASFGGVAVQLSGNGYGVLPGIASGFDDATAARFTAATKIELATEGADRFHKRTETLLGAERSQWSAWRTAELTGFYARLSERVRKGQNKRVLVLCTEELFAGRDAAERLRQAAAGHATVADALAETGVDLPQLAATEGIIALRPYRQTADASLPERAIEMRLSGASELDGPAELSAGAGELFFRAASRLRLASFDAQSPFGPEATFLALSSAATPAGDAALGPEATALAAHDALAIVEGADFLSLTESPAAVQRRRLLASLPTEASDVRTERRQPATARIYRGKEATTICIVNESPWNVDVELPLEAEGAGSWTELGAATSASSTGETKPGATAWKMTLAPYGVAARRYSVASLRVGSMTVTPEDAAKAALAARVAEVERRVQGLDVERPYAQLQNPDFELVGADGRMSGWQPRIGSAGAVEIDAAQAAAGSRSLSLKSEDALGVAAQSHLFPIPGTGLLAVRAQVRGEGLGPESRLIAWIEYDDGGVMKRRYTVLAVGDELGSTWEPCEAAIDDLPLGTAGQMRIQFHLAGAGQAWVDDVRMYDLRFAAAQRKELVIGLLAAQTALNEGQIVDCLRLVDGYLPRSLVEYVPPAQDAGVEIASRPEEPQNEPADDGSGRKLGDRLRGMVPKILR